MNSRLLPLLVLVFLASLAARAQSTIRVFTSVKFYDGYAPRVSNPPPVPGILRHRNDLYARKLEQWELDEVGSTLRINVIIRALCDNYDRIGNVNLALVPKGDTAYHPDSVQRIELARFITPFMNKNIWPDTVPYSFQADNVAHLLHDSALRARYDFWAELQVFGVPYAAQQQISGCAGRIDVFNGMLDFVTDRAAPVLADNVLLPLQFMRNLTNYDTAGHRYPGQDHPHHPGRCARGPGGCGAVSHHLQPRREQQRRGIQPPLALRVLG